MKPATIILAAALAVAGPFAFAQSAAPAPGAPATGATVGVSPSTGSTAGTATGGTGGISNGAGSIAAGRNSAANPSGNSQITPPPGSPNTR
jgi:hypothetical protein